jgi:hypothetical protein
MTGAVPAADPAAPAAGNATILSGTGAPPAPDPTPPIPAPPPTEPAPPADPADPPEDGAGEAKGPPEQYEFQAPEGVALDPAAVEAFAPVARDLNLTQEQAQRLVDVYAGLQRQQAAAQSAQAQRWAEQVRDDPEIGARHGAAQVEAAVAAVTRFGTPELAELLTATGLGNHPELVRVFARVGKAIGDDRHVTAAQPAAQSTDFATQFYAGMAR